MVMELDFKGRVNNTRVPNGSGLDTVLEAVVNSIQAMDADSDNPYIKIRLISNQKTLDGKESSQITGFVIEDNGVGFTDVNYQSFRKVDSMHKFNLGCKGIGRLSWLKVFDNVMVDSVYCQDGKKYRRQFSFSLDADGVYGGDEPEPSSLPIRTIISLENCKFIYFNSIQSGPKALATKIFDHCIAYFLHGKKQPIIRIEGSDEIEIVNDIYDSIQDRIIQHPKPILIGNYEFDLYHVRFKQLTGDNGISLCANDLEVKTVLKFNRTYMDSDNQEFRYKCFVYSPLLDERVNSSRDGFDLGDKSRLIPDYEMPCIKEIMDAINPICDEFLKPYSETYVRKCSQRLKKFVESESGCMFSATVKYDPELISSIKPEMTDEELYRKCSDSQSKMESQIIFNPNRKKGPVDDSSAIEEHLDKITNLQKDQLTRLIIHRGLILSAFDERLEAIQSEYKDDKIKFSYELESVIHDIILPRGTDRKNRAILETCNLWIIDDRLEYYAFYGAYSDRNLCDISDNESKLRPDIFLFGDITESMEAKSICIIELKRPGRKDVNIIEQIYDYIDALKHSKIPNYRGEKVSITDGTVFYCYAICNTAVDDIKTLASRNQMKPMFGDRGFFNWNREYNCSIDLIDHHKIFADAKMRNKVFFSIIGMDTSSDMVKVQKGPQLMINLNSEIDGA